MRDKINNLFGGRLAKPVKTGANKYPDKTSINLIVRDSEMDPKKRVVIMVLVAIIAALFLKFMIFDRIWAGYEAQRDYTEMKTKIAELQIVTGDYEKVRAEYSHYGNSYANQEESVEQDRAVIMSVINSDVLSKADMQSLEVTGNVATVSIDNIRLGTVSAIVASLESEQTVSFVNVSTAGTNTNDAGSTVQATLSITFNDGGEN